MQNIQDSQTATDLMVNGEMNAAQTTPARNNLDVLIRQAQDKLSEITVQLMTNDKPSEQKKLNEAFNAITNKINQALQAQGLINKADRKSVG